MCRKKKNLSAREMEVYKGRKKMQGEQGRWKGWSSQEKSDTEKLGARECEEGWERE